MDSFTKSTWHLSSPPNPKLTFFSLPPETRRKIYILALQTTTSSQIMIRSTPSQCKATQSFLVGMSDISLDIHPALLCASRAIHREATPVLYGSGNTFQFSYPLPTLAWLEQIGGTNLGLLFKVRINVEATVRKGASEGWGRVLRKLGGGAQRLGSMHVYFDEGDEMWQQGLGRDRGFVRGLAGLKSLMKLELGGYFEEDWVAELEGAIGKGKVVRT